jgi:pectate lyase
MSEQEIVACLSESLGTPIGYGENATGGYDPDGDSNLVVIKRNTGVLPEQLLLDAISSTDHNWIVFDKDDFANGEEIAMYRLHCSDSDVLNALGGASEAECLDYEQWCSNNGVSSSECTVEFYNDLLNDSDLPIRNPMINSNTTIDGRGSNAVIRFSGFKIGADSSGAATATAESVILTHLNFKGAGHTEDHNLDPDMIRSTGESHDIWIHKNTFDLTGDSAFDVKVGAYNITISFNRLFDVKRAVLHGSSDSRTINEQIRTTMHHNAFITRDDMYETFGNVLRRVPLLRRGASHIFNNVFLGYRRKIFSIRVGGDLEFEDNVVMINDQFQEKDSVEDSLDARADQLFEVKDGTLSPSGTKLYFFTDGTCTLNDEYVVDMSSRSEGSAPDMTSDYNSNSQSVMDAQYKSAGQDLADYIFITAGHDGAVPFNSPWGLSQSETISNYSVTCQ